MPYEALIFQFKDIPFFLNKYELNYQALEKDSTPPPWRHTIRVKMRE